MMRQSPRSLVAMCCMVVLLGALLSGCSRAPAPAATQVPAAEPPAAIAVAQPTVAQAQEPAPTAVQAPTAEPTAVPAGPVTLDLGIEWEQNSLQPETDGIYLMRFGVVETLVAVSFDDALVPGLATDWERVDELTWKFQLRAGVKFHNGQLFDADAAVFSLKRAIDAKGSDASIKGATVEAQGTDAILIHTAQPSNIIPAVMADWETAILSKDSYDADGNVTNPIGTGPFVYGEWTRGQRVVVTQFADYWNGKPKADKAVFHFIPDGSTRATMLRTGEMQIVRAIPVDDAATIESDSNVTVISSPLRRFRAMYLNNSRPPFDNLKVRQAINHAIDKEGIVKHVLGGFGSVAQGPFSPELPWSPALTGYDYSPDKAKALLAEAGYKPGDLSFTILTYAGRPELPVIAEVIQQQLKEVGVAVQIQILEYAPLEQQLLAGDFEASLLARNPAFRVYDPQSYLESDYSSTGAFNLSHYANPTVDELVSQAAAETEVEARHKLQQEVQSIAIDQDAIGVFLNYYVQIDGHVNGVTGYRTHPTEFRLLTENIGVTSQK